MKLLCRFATNYRGYFSGKARFMICIESGNNFRKIPTIRKSLTWRLMRDGARRFSATIKKLCKN
jgi:hypothetical protein